MKTNDKKEIDQTIELGRAQKNEVSGTIRFYESQLRNGSKTDDCFAPAVSSGTREKIEQLFSGAEFMSVDAGLSYKDRVIVSVSVCWQGEMEEYPPITFRFVRIDGELKIYDFDYRQIGADGLIRDVANNRCMIKTKSMISGLI